MKITEDIKFVKVGTLLKDDEGYFIVINHDEQFDCYICIECDEFILAMLDKYGVIIFNDGSFDDDTFDNSMYCFGIKDLIELGVEIVKEY